MVKVQEDNMYTRRKVVPTVRPEEQEQAEDKELVEVRSQYTVIVEVIERLKADVQYYDTNAGVPDEVLRDPTEFMHCVEGNKKAVASIQREIETLEDLLEKHVR